MAAIVSQPRSAGPAPAAEGAGGDGRGTTFRNLSVMALFCTSGTLVITTAYYLSRANEALPEARGLYWLGLGIVYVPLFVQLLRRDISRSERIGLVALAGALLYLLKLLHDPVVFTYSDEFAHLVNAQNLVESGRLYSANAVLPPISQYPGVAVCAAAVSQVTGLGLFGSGLLVIGVVRVLLLVGTVLLVERITDSARLAGLTAVLYCANSNYLFYSAQFSYESLALPLLVVVLVCAVHTRRLDASAALGWGAMGALIIVAVAATHHLTSYALAGVLWLLVAVAAGTRRSRPIPPVALAAVATLACATWLLLVGGTTGEYLGSIFTRAYDSVHGALAAEQATRIPFAASTTSGESVLSTPLVDKLLGLMSVVLTVIFVPWGARILRRRHWDDAMVVILTLSGLAFLLTYGVRIFPGAWETANRSSEFLYFGVALAIAAAATSLADSHRFRPAIRWAAISLGAFLLFAGGSVLGWPSAIRLPPPLQVKAGGATIEPANWAAAQWASTHLSRKDGFVADEAAGRILAIHGGFHNILFGRQEGATPLLTELTLPPWERALLKQRKLRYVIIADPRPWDISNTTGFFFSRPGDQDDEGQLTLPGVRAKFEGLQGTSRIYDSGQLVIDDVRPFLGRSGAAVAHARAAYPKGSAATVLMWVAAALSALMIAVSAILRGRPPRPHGLALLGFAAGAGSVLLLAPSMPVVSLVIGLPLLLVAPGFALTSVLFGPAPPPRTECALLSTAGSLAVLIVGAVLFNALGAPLDEATFAKLALSVTLLAGAGAVLRRWSAPSRFRLRLPAAASGAAVGCWLLVILAAVACVLILRAPYASSGVTGSSALWALPHGSGAVRVGVVSNRTTPTAYRVEARRGGRVIDSYEFRLAPGGRWSRVLASPRSPSAPTELTLRGRTGNAFELRRVWIRNPRPR
jgi:hypothetical protein